jgi:hypothetical protein
MKRIEMPPLRYSLVARSALVAAAIAVSGTCSRQPAPPPAPDYAPVASIKDIMQAIVDPSADVVWNSVKVVETAAKVENIAPLSDEDWANVRHAAIRLVEGANLLMMPGRHVAPPGDTSATPGVELEPAQIEANIASDRATWYKLATALRETALVTLKAVDAKDLVSEPAIAA